VYTKEIGTESELSAGLTRLSVGLKTNSTNTEETNSNFD